MLAGSLLFLCTALLATDPCRFIRANEVLQLSQLQDCFKAIPLDKDGVGYPTLDTLMKLNEMYVFNEMAKEPIAPYDVPTNAYKLQHVDVRRELQAIRDNIDSYKTDFDFHDAVSAIYLRLKDPHTRYDKPRGYSSMQVILPLTVTAAYRNRMLEFTLTELPPEYQFVTWEYRRMLSEQGININKYIDQRIYTINNIPAAEAVQQFADDMVYISKNPHARLNSVLRADFFLRSLRTFGWPGRTGSPMDTEVLSITFYDGSTLELPFLAYVTEEIRSTNDLKNRIMADTDTVQVKQNGASDIRDTPMGRFIVDTVKDVAPAVPETARTLPPVGHVATSSTAADDEYYINLEHEGVDITLYSLRKNSNLVAYLLNIPTFAPDSPVQFVDDFEASMKILDATKVKNPFLIVNVARNGGGYVTLGYRTLHVLAPYINPLYGNYTVRKSEYAEFYSMRGNFSAQSRYRLSDWMRYKNNAWYSGSTESIMYMTGHEDFFSGIYTFDLAYDEVDFQEAFERLINIKTPKFLADSGNANLVFVTDGLCGSTCSCFAKRAREAHVGVWIGMGGNPLLRKPEDDTSDSNMLVDMDVASFAGGSVMDTQYIFDASFGSLYEKRLDLYPLPTTATHRWTFEQIFSWNWSQPFDPIKTPLEYVNNPVDDYIDYWPGAGSRYLDENTYLTIAQEAYKKVSFTCYSFQMKKSRYCHSVDSGLYANPCNLTSHKYDEDACSFFACIDGYMMTQKGICIEQPDKWDQPISALETGIYAGLAVVLALIIAALAGYFVYKCIKYKKHVDKCKEEGTWRRNPSIMSRLKEIASRRRLRKEMDKGASDSKLGTNQDDEADAILEV